MRPPILAAALFAALVSSVPSTRAQDVPEPESHTVLEPPAQETPPAQQVAAPAPSDHAREARSELGFQLRAGAADTDRFLLGGSFVGSSGPLTFGLSGDTTLDVRGGGHHHHDAYGDDAWSDWCEQRSDGRCLRRADFALSGFGGLRQRTAPFLGGARLRLELVGELGWQLSYVEERIQTTSGAIWSDASRAYPFAGVRGGLGVSFLRSAYVGVGAFARKSLSGQLCVNTDGGCTHVGGVTRGVFLFGGGEWGIGH
jgi:hypothetical protein